MVDFEIQTQILEHAKGLPLPTYQTSGSAGMDLYAATFDNIDIHPNERVLVPTGLIMGIPRRYEGQIRPRSGWALKHGLTVLNAPGTIDSDYRGEIKVLLINLGNEVITIQRGMRIAQLIIAPVMQVECVETDEVKITYRDITRQQNGFGSTGE